WTKNIIVFAALVFDGKLFDLPLLWETTIVALCFCLVSSSVYVINDLADVEKDRLHPRKRNRPLAAGTLNPTFATVGAVLLALVGIGVAAWVSPWVGLVAGAYLLQNILYSFWLKNVVILDVMVLALGFLLRVVAGALVVQVSNFSPWLYVCVTLLALFLGFGKRRHELTLLEGNASGHRASLQEYNLPLLDQIIGIVTTSTFVAYTLYGIEAQTALAQDGRMLLTSPFVFYFIARYLYLIHVKKLGGAPDELLMQDRALMINTALWAGSVVALIYLAG
ncbi:MAG: decaprenyl-phosphate phosphoribosyltransferase, partial [Caldilineaceae bacterium]